MLLSEETAAKRKQHGKSKAGCKNCRARKVKCDESRPICKACHRRKEECAWDDSEDPFTTFLTPAAIQTLHVPLERQLAIGSCSEFNLKDLELLHTWSTKTFVSLVPNLHALHHAYTTLVPELAFRHQTLLHAIFAYSALQLHTSNPDGDYMWVAKTHCQKALQGLRRELGYANMEVNFLTNFVLASYWAASPSWHAEQNTTPNLFSWFPAARRFMVGLTPYWRCVANGHLRDSPFLPEFIVDAASIPNGDSPIPSFVYGIHRKECCSLDAKELDDPQLVQVYDDVLSALAGAANLALHPLLGVGALYLFPGACPEEFSRLLREGKPRALIILAQFCALLSSYDGTWWYGPDRSKRDLQQIVELLDEKWLPWMQYPMDVLKRNMGNDALQVKETSFHILPATSLVAYTQLPPEIDMSMSWMAPTFEQEVPWDVIDTTTHVAENSLNSDEEGATALFML